MGHIRAPIRCTSRGPSWCVKLGHTRHDGLPWRVNLRPCFCHDGRQLEFTLGRSRRRKFCSKIPKKTRTILWLCYIGYKKPRYQQSSHRGACDRAGYPIPSMLTADDLFRGVIRLCVWGPKGPRVWVAGVPTAVCFTLEKSSTRHAVLSQLAISQYIVSEN